MPRQIVALSERYYRRLLYSCATLLSVAIISALVFLGYSAFNQFRERQVGDFIAKREQIKSEVDRLSARVTQFAEMYDRLQRLYQADLLPADQYQNLLGDNGISPSPENLTVVPFSLLVPPGVQQDDARLASLLLLLRQASALPMFNAGQPGATLDGAIYTSSHDFLAMSPPLTPAERTVVLTDGIRRYIDKLGAPIDAAFAAETRRAASAQGSAGQRVLWLNPPAANVPGEREAVTRLAVRIFLSRGDIVTAVFSVPWSQFRQFFMRGENAPGFFIFDGRSGDRLISRPTASVPADVMKHILEHVAHTGEILDHAGHFHQNGSFFIAQKIDGPDWVVVYTFGWRDVLAGLHGDFTTGAFWGIFALLFVWAAALYFDKFVIAPLRDKALALIETRQFSQSIIDTLPVGIVVYGIGSHDVMLQNSVATRMLEHAIVSHGEFYAQIVKECSASEMRFSGDLDRMMIEADVRLSGGGLNHFGVFWSRTRFSGQDVLLLGLIDMNMHKAHETLMLEAKSAADRANAAKSMFLAQVSHEIRTPLHGAIGHMELLSHEGLSTQQRKRVDLIRHAFDMLMSMVNDILDITKIEANAIRLSPGALNVNDLLEECAQLYAPLAQNKGLEFFCLPDPALEASLKGDAQRLMQILQNLVGNAVKFTEHGHVSIAVRQLNRKAGRIRLAFEVSDTGIGISEQARERIFESLEQADDTISRRFGGTGLGLSLCRHLAELMEGSIELSSEVGQGSRFCAIVVLDEYDCVPVFADTPLQGRVVEIRSDEPAMGSMLGNYVRYWGARVSDDTPGDKSSADALLIAQGNVPMLLPEKECGAIPMVIIRTDTARQVAGLGPCRVASAFDRRSWLAALREEAPTVLAAAGDAPTAAAAPWSNLDILVAEDDHVNLLLIEHQLQALGCVNIRLARDGIQALRQWRERAPDLLITDLGMPHMDGIALAREIRVSEEGAVIVASTAAAPGTASSELDIFDEVIYKPASLEDLREVLRKHAAGANAPRSEAPTTETGHGIPAVSLPAPTIAASALEQTLYAAFLQSWQGERGKIADAMAAGDHERLQRLLHRVQGGLLAMGQDDLAHESLALQALVKEEQLSALALERCTAWLGAIDVLCLDQLR